MVIVHRKIDRCTSTAWTEGLKFVGIIRMEIYHKVFPKISFDTLLNCTER